MDVQAGRRTDIQKDGHRDREMDLVLALALVWSFVSTAHF